MCIDLALATYSYILGMNRNQKKVGCKRTLMTKYLCSVDVRALDVVLVNSSKMVDYIHRNSVCNRKKRPPKSAMLPTIE